MRATGWEHGGHQGFVDGEGTIGITVAQGSEDADAAYLVLTPEGAQSLANLLHKLADQAGTEAAS